MHTETIQNAFVESKLQSREKIPYLAEPHDRLKWAREHAGYTEATEAADAMGLKRSTYLGHENGNRGLSRNGERYARFFKVSLEWLFANRGQPFPPKPEPARDHSQFTEVPLLSWVSAGRLADATVDIPAEDVPLIPFADLGRGDFFALTVEGDSMDRVSPEGSKIVVNRADRTLIPGRCYVFSWRGETTYKRWQDDDQPYLAPYSTNPAHRPIFPKRKRDVEVIGRVRRTLLDL